MIVSWGQQYRLCSAYEAGYIRCSHQGCEPHMLTLHHHRSFEHFGHINRPHKGRLSNHLFCSTEQRRCISRSLTGCHHPPANLFTRHHHQPAFLHKRGASKLFKRGASELFKRGASELFKRRAPKALQARNIRVLQARSLIAHQARILRAPQARSLIIALRARTLRALQARSLRK